MRLSPLLMTQTQSFLVKQLFVLGEKIVLSDCFRVQHSNITSGDCWRMVREVRSDRLVKICTPKDHDRATDFRRLIHVGLF
jgi:hypothetical protein